MRGFVLSRFHLTGEEAAENAARSQTALGQTAISQKPDSHRPDSKKPDSHRPDSKKPDSHQPDSKSQTANTEAGPPSAGPQKARDVETFRAFALISSQMRSRAHQAMLAEVRLRAILRTFRSLRILRTLWPFRPLGATLRSLGHIL